LKKKKRKLNCRIQELEEEVYDVQTELGQKEILIAKQAMENAKTSDTLRRLLNKLHESDFFETQRCFFCFEPFKLDRIVECTKNCHVRLHERCAYAHEEWCDLDKTISNFIEYKMFEDVDEESSEKT
jgi:hypothetical protein